MTILLRIFRCMWIGFECAAEYVTMIVITLICTILKAVLQIAWLPVVGLLWWFNFYRNLINDPNGRPLLEIFRCPESGYYRYVGPKRPRHSVKRWKDSNGIWHQQEKPRFIAPLFPLENNKKRRHPRPFRKMFPGIKRSAPLPTCYLPINHRENRKRIEYFDIEIPATPFVTAMDMLVYHIWNEHMNASFFSETNIIIVSLWLTIGYRCFKLILSIFARWITKIMNCFAKVSN